MKFSERLVYLRKSHKLTQKQLAAKIQLSELAIQNYEAERRKPAFDVILALANCFDVSVDYLLGLTDDPTKYVAPVIEESNDDDPIVEEPITVSASMGDLKKLIEFMRSQGINYKIVDNLLIVDDEEE